MPVAMSGQPAESGGCGGRSKILNLCLSARSIDVR
jgi:hypothetical protein